MSTYFYRNTGDDEKQLIAVRLSNGREKGYRLEWHVTFTDLLRVALFPPTGQSLPFWWDDEPRSALEFFNEISEATDERPYETSSVFRNDLQPAASIPYLLKRSAVFICPNCGYTTDVHIPEFSGNMVKSFCCKAQFRITVTGGVLFIVRIDDRIDDEKAEQAVQRISGELF